MISYFTPNNVVTKYEVTNNIVTLHAFPSKTSKPYSTVKTLFTGLLALAIPPASGKCNAI